MVRWHTLNSQTGVSPNISPQWHKKCCKFVKVSCKSRETAHCKLNWNPMFFPNAILQFSEVVFYLCGQINREFVKEGKPDLVIDFPMEKIYMFVQRAFCLVAGECRRKVKKRFCRKYDHLDEKLHDYVVSRNHVQSVQFVIISGFTTIQCTFLVGDAWTTYTRWFHWV